jgi:HTH-like domain
MALLQKELEERPAVERALRALGEAVGLSRSTIFRHLHPPSLSSSTNDVELRGQIQNVALEMRSYGYRPITKELHRRGVQANHKRVLRVLREDNLLCLRRQAFVRTTDSNHALTVYPNLTRGLVLSNINQLWVSDITYIRLRRELSISPLCWMLTAAAASAGRSRVTSTQNWRSRLCAWPWPTAPCHLAWSIIPIAACSMLLQITSHFCKHTRSRSA